METPSSTTKRVTRSQALAALNGNTAAANNNNNIPISKKMEDSDKGVSQSRRRSAKQQQDRSALIDITNDSPIVGLAMGNLETPSSGLAKQRSGIAKSTNTPGSGEALLRGQVKTLLQKVEEEAELSKLSLQNRPFLRLQGFTNSPMGLLAPTPANTPQVPNLSEDILASVTPSPILEEQIKISEVEVVVNDLFDGKSLESQKSLTRSLMLDFTEKSEISDVSSECSSVLTSKENSPATDDDNASLWSLQVNASARDEDEEEEEEEEEGDDRWLVDELCEGISNMCVDENRMGKHTRYVYNSDDEIVDEEVDGSLSPNVVRLKGFPTPKGKHLRFQTEECMNG